MNRNAERRLLQIAVGIACAVPLLAGGAGVVEGTGIPHGILGSEQKDLESHFRYLSGLLLGLGLAYAACIPSIERRSELFGTLTGLVILGGLARAAHMFAAGLPSPPHQFALIMELIVVPLLYLWQRRVVRRFSS